METQIEKIESEIQKAVPYIPDADVFESEDSYTVLVNLPGVENEHLISEVNSGYLVVRGIRRLPDILFNADVVTKQMQSHYGSFQRRIKLNSKANPLAIKAELGSGVLTINIPKL